MVWIKGHTFSTIRPMIVGAWGGCFDKYSYRLSAEKCFDQFEYSVQFINNAARRKWKAAVADEMVRIYNGADIGHTFSTIRPMIVGATMNQPQFCSIRAARESAAVTMVWRWIFNGDYGILNQLFGIHVAWVTDPKVALVSCAVVAIWSAIGYDAVLLLSGLQNISKSYYEAC